MSLRMELRELENRKAQSRKDKLEVKLENLQKKPKKLLKALFDKKIKHSLLQKGSPYQLLGEELQKNWKYSRGSRKGFFHFILEIIDKSDRRLFTSKKNITVLRYIYHFSKEALRPLDSWQMPLGDSTKKMINSLAHHLYAKYPVPEFMNQAFWKSSEIHIDWFIRLGKGENLRKAPGLPCKITKKMAHYFVSEKPEGRSIENTLIFAIIRGMGGNSVLASNILANTRMNFYQAPEFWSTVFRFFINQEDLPLDQVSPLLDYIQDQKFDQQIVLLERNRLQENGPAQPEFTMKGRTLPPLLKAMEKWHRDLQRLNPFGGNQRVELITWMHKGVNNFEYEIKEGDKAGKYHIDQLLSNWELYAEGNFMKHCVSSYTHSCVQKIASIWSFYKLEQDKSQTKLLTIEMKRSQKKVVQIRGMYNSRAADWQMEIIRKWAKQEKLTIAEWS